MQRLLKIFCVTFCLMTVPVISRAACSIIIDGEPLSAVNADGAAVEPFIENGTTYAPVRAIATALGAQISWEQSSLTVYIGTKGGSPTLNEYVNIYYNGEEFAARDVDGDRVYPILRDGTTYLPVRAIGELFGKRVSWDPISQTVTLSTPCGENALSYFKSSVLNTELLKDLTADVSFTGELYYGGAPVSEISEHAAEAYGSAGFSFASFLPPDYDSAISYLGGGKYFLNVPSYTFSSSSFVTEAMSKANAEALFSNLGITAETKGAYITSMNISACGKVSCGGAVFDLSFQISASVNYPESFKFPLVPPPSGGTNESTDNSGSTSDQSSSVAGANEDAAAISEIAASYIEHVLASDAEGASRLLCPADYNALFGSRSQSQLKLDFSTASHNLSKKYSGADGTYTVEAMDYAPNPELYTEGCEKAIKITASVIIKDGDYSRADELRFTVIKTDGKWYIDKESMQNILP